MLLWELHGRGPTFHDTEYKYLYHMTDGHGFSRTITDNALRPLRQDYVSTTYDPTKNFVEGYSHYFFKFVLNGKALVQTYGGFNYDHHMRVGEKMTSLNEKEIGIDTRSIEPFNKYLHGCVLLSPVFSQATIQSLLYDNTPTTKFLQSTIEKTQAPRTITALRTMLMEWKKPLWIGGDEMRKPNAEEWEFLKDCFAIHERGGNFAQGLRELAGKYPIIDHWNKRIDSEIVARRQMSPKIYGAFNKYYADRQFHDVDVNVLRAILDKSITLLGYGDNVKTMLMASIAAHGLLSPVVSPVDWSGFFNDLYDGEVEEALEAVQVMAKQLKRKMDLYGEDPERFKWANHSRTQF